MVRKDKLISRLKTRPSDFTFEEAVTLLRNLGCHLCEKGRTSGSRVVFVSEEHGKIILRRPHPDRILKQLVEYLERENLI